MKYSHDESKVPGQTRRDREGNGIAGIEEKSGEGASPEFQANRRRNCDEELARGETNRLLSTDPSSIVNTAPSFDKLSRRNPKPGTRMIANQEEEEEENNFRTNPRSFSLLQRRGEDFKRGWEQLDRFWKLVRQNFHESKVELRAGTRQKGCGEKEKTNLNFSLYEESLSLSLRKLSSEWKIPWIVSSLSLNPRNDA